MIWRAAALGASLTLGPLPAAALECFEILPETLWFDAVASEAQQLPVVGVFSAPLAAVRLEGESWWMDGPISHFTARFEGHALTRHGFIEPLASEVAVAAYCSGGVCAEFGQGLELMTLLRIDADGYALRLDACGAPAVRSPGPADLRRMRECLRGRCGDPRVD